MKKLREQLGLNQTEMAKLIGTSKTKASLYEKGIRNFNSKELSLLSSIELLMEEAPDIQNQEAIILHDQKAVSAVLKKLIFERKQAERKHEILLEKLSRMEEAHTNNQNLWRLINSIKKNFTNPGQIPYASIMEIKCQEKMKSCGPHQQILLRHQLNLLESEVESANQLIAAYRGFGVMV